MWYGFTSLLLSSDSLVLRFSGHKIIDLRTVRLLDVVTDVCYGRTFPSSYLYLSMLYSQMPPQHNNNDNNEMPLACSSC
jgi:hypothetical protein